MAEEVKIEQQDDSSDTAEKAVEENPPVDKEQSHHNTEENDAEAGTTTPDEKSIDPEDQTFWEDSVDANSVDISGGPTAQTEDPGDETQPKAQSDDQPGEQEPVAEHDAEQSEAQVEEQTAAVDTPPAEEEPVGKQEESSTPEIEETENASPTPSPQGEEGKDQPEEQEPVAENDAEQVEAQAEEETAAADTPPPEEESATAEEAQEPDGDEKKPPTAEKEETDNTSSTPNSPEGENEKQPVDQEPVAEKDPEQEETTAEEDNAAAASDESQPKGKVLSFYRHLNKKTLIAGSGILLLIAGSIGFTVVPGLRSSDSITSTFMGGMPETAYDMKFFLPLDVGYEKSQFVKVTIALELMDEGLQKEIDKNISQLRKEVINLILTKSPKEVKSSSGKKELSREITSRINNYLSKDCIKDTYFTELVIL